MGHSQRVLRGKFTTKCILCKEKETSQINNLSSHLKNLGKDEQNKPKTSRRRDKDQSKDQEN